MDEVQQFFYDHAGFSYDPETETPEEGQRRCARALAANEAWLVRQAITFEVEPDVDTATTAADEQVERIERGESVYLMAALVDEDEKVLASVGGIEVTDENDPYLRVIRAELASEVRS